MHGEEKPLHTKIENINYNRNKNIKFDKIVPNSPKQI